MRKIGEKSDLQQSQDHLNAMRSLTEGERVEGTTDWGRTGTGTFGTVEKILDRGRAARGLRNAGVPSIRVCWDNGRTVRLQRAAVRRASR